MGFYVNTLPIHEPWELYHELEEGEEEEEDQGEDKQPDHCIEHSQLQRNKISIRKKAIKIDPNLNFD